MCCLAVHFSSSTNDKSSIYCSDRQCHTIFTLNRMKILHLISQYPQQTGSGFYIQNIIRQCKAKGYSVHLIAAVSGDNAPELPFLEDNEYTLIRFEQGELDFTIPGMSDVMPYPSSRFSNLSEAQLECYCRVFHRTVQEVVAKFCPDVIHSHHLWLASDMARAACPGIPMVTSCHSTDLRQYLQNQHLQRRLQHIGKIERILALSKVQKEDISRTHNISPGSIDIVGGGYDSARFYPRKKSPTLPVEILYAGKLSRAKGVPFLLQAAKRLLPGKVRLHLVGSGSGAEKEECLQLAEAVEDRVTVHGSIPQEDLAKFMRRCHIFVLPSLYEGLPLVLLEALSSGCRLVCSDLPGCRELLQKVDTNMAAFIPLPAMQSIDTPHPDQHQPFINSIEAAVATMVERVTVEPQLPEAEIRKLTESYSWEAVFSRVEMAYRKVVQKDSAESSIELQS